VLSCPMDDWCLSVSFENCDANVLRASDKAIKTFDLRKSTAGQEIGEKLHTRNRLITKWKTKLQSHNSLLFVLFIISIVIVIVSLQSTVYSESMSRVKVIYNYVRSRKWFFPFNIFQLSFKFNFLNLTQHTFQLFKGSNLTGSFVWFQLV
jgi:hypothetical protein